MRLEALGESANEVRDCLLESAERVLNNQNGGSWIEEEPGLSVVTSKNGFWGRFTLRRQDDKNDKVQT